MSSPARFTDTMVSTSWISVIRRIDFINLAARSIVVTPKGGGGPVAMSSQPMQSGQASPPAASPEFLDRSDPEAEIARAVRAYSNWGRWGADDVLGTANFITDGLRLTAAGLVRRGASFSLSQRFDMDGPQRGWRRRTNPVHTMLGTGTDAALGNQGFPHGIGGADDVIAMPLQCSTQWDGLGHIFDHGKAWNGRDAARTVTSDGFAITAEHLTTTAAAHGVTVGRGDLVLVRTGQYARALREGWGNYAGGAAPGLSFTTAGWLHRTEIAAVATDTWGFEVRPNEFDDAFQPLHQVAIPHLGLLIGEMWALEELADDCAADGVYEFFLTAAPLPITGAVGSPVNPIAVK